MGWNRGRLPCRWPPLLPVCGRPVGRRVPLRRGTARPGALSALPRVGGWGSGLRARTGQPVWTPGLDGAGGGALIPWIPREVVLWGAVPMACLGFSPRDGKAQVPGAPAGSSQAQGRALRPRAKSSVPPRRHATRRSQGSDRRSASPRREASRSPGVSVSVGSRCLPPSTVLPGHAANAVAGPDRSGACWACLVAPVFPGLRSWLRLTFRGIGRPRSGPLTITRGWHRAPPFHL